MIEYYVGVAESGLKRRIANPNSVGSNPTTNSKAGIAQLVEQ